MKKTALMIVLVLAEASVGCTPQPPLVCQELFAHAIPFCQMMSQKESYREKSVTVSGLYILSPHNAELYAESCENQSIKLHGEVGLPDSKRAWTIVGQATKSISGARIPVVFRGVLHARQYIVIPNCNESCFEWSLERAQLLAADGAHVRHPPV
ncbi:hypothetical protein [Sphingomonas sp. URHD0057]|uniref:hypothetical protein n=1 Tax=Sphingomonas sp. URHD0057 TaxID=1380389 RepID=UPI0012DD51DD|nr:hypothetical protein [Sphingomonas sp. URHD0057]